MQNTFFRQSWFTVSVKRTELYLLEIQKGRKMFNPDIEINQPLMKFIRILSSELLYYLRTTFTFFFSNIQHSKQTITIIGLNSMTDCILSENNG